MTRGGIKRRTETRVASVRFFLRYTYIIDLEYLDKFFSQEKKRLDSMIIIRRIMATRQCCRPGILVILLATSQSTVQRPTFHGPHPSIYFAVVGHASVKSFQVVLFVAALSRRCRSRDSVRRTMYEREASERHQLRGTTLPRGRRRGQAGVETRESPSGPNYTDTRSRHYGPANSRGESYINLGELIVQFQFRLSSVRRGR